MEQYDGLSRIWSDEKTQLSGRYRGFGLGRLGSCERDYVEQKSGGTHHAWGALIVVFSVLSLFGGATGGFGIGLILGLIGSALAVT
jgi:hypothetical protein